MPAEEQNQSLGKFVLEISGEHEMAYLKLPTYPKTDDLKVSRNVRLISCLGNYKGPDVVFDFDQEGILVGIEILAE